MLISDLYGVLWWILSHLDQTRLAASSKARRSFHTIIFTYNGTKSHSGEQCNMKTVIHTYAGHAISGIFRHANMFTSTNMIVKYKVAAWMRMLLQRLFCPDAPEPFALLIHLTPDINETPSRTKRGVSPLNS